MPELSNIDHKTTLRVWMHEYIIIKKKKNKQKKNKQNWGSERLNNVPKVAKGTKGIRNNH